MFFQDISKIFKSEEGVLENADEAIKKSKRQMYYSKLSLFEEQMVKFGKIDFVPFEELQVDTFIEISNGWRSKCIKTSFFENEEEENTWIVFCEKGTQLPTHKHTQEEFVYVVSGSIKRIETNEILKEGQEMIISSLEEHGFISTQDSILIVTFRPPLKVNLN